MEYFVSPSFIKPKSKTESFQWFCTSLFLKALHSIKTWSSAFYFSYVSIFFTWELVLTLMADDCWEWTPCFCPYGVLQDVEQWFFFFFFFISFIYSFTLHLNHNCPLLSAPLPQPLPPILSLLRRERPPLEVKIYPGTSNHCRTRHIFSHLNQIGSQVREIGSTVRQKS